MRGKTMWTWHRASELRLVVVRHGRGLHNEQPQARAEKIQDFSNHAAPLVEKGIEQAKQCGDRVRALGYTFDLAMHSTMVRTQETLHHMNLGVPDSHVVEDQRLDEWFRGVRHSLPRSQLNSSHPHDEELLRLYGYYHHRSEGGENGADVEKRARSLLRDLERILGKNVCLVTHGHFMLVMRKVLEQHNVAWLHTHMHASTPRNCEIWVCTWKPEVGRWTITIM